MTEAIFGLVGVAVGAVVTGGVNFVMERRRELADLRQAKRLLGEELHTCWLSLSLMVRAKRWLGAPQYVESLFPMAAWEAHRNLLARSLPDSSWTGLPEMFTTIRMIELTALEKGIEPLSDEWARLVTVTAADAADLYGELMGRPSLDSDPALREMLSTWERHVVSEQPETG